jgi:uncharacterized repeat protein (TIGR01451 family)/gliding motility-associated-like protein
LTANNCSGTILWSTGSTDATIQVGQGTYSATCSNTCGTSGSSNEVIIIEKCAGCEVATPIISASKTSLCSSETVTLTVTNCSGTVLWSNGLTGSTINVTPVISTEYSAVCKLNETCYSSASEPLKLMIHNIAPPVLSCSSDLVCPGSDLTLNAYGCSGEVVWSNGLTGSVINVVPTSTFTITAKCKVDNCESESSEALEVAVGTPSAPFISCQSKVLCLNETTYLNAKNCSGVVHWSNGQTGNMLQLVADSVGVFSYTAYCTSAVGQCRSEDSNEIIIRVYDQPEAPQVISEISNNCPFGFVNLSSALISAPSENSVYEFHVSNSVNSPLLTNTNYVFGGNYYVFERSRGGCVSPASQITVSIDDCGTGVILPDSSKYVDLSISKTADNGLVSVGDSVRYTISVQNLSTNVATSVVVRDLIPNGLKVLEASSEVSNELFFTIDTLKALQSYTYTYLTEVTGNGTIVNKAELFGMDQKDSTFSNNYSEFTIQVRSSNPLGLAKNLVDTAHVENGVYELAYDVYLTNYGSDVIHNVQVEEDLDRAFGNGAIIISDTIAVSTTGSLIPNANFTGRPGGYELLQDSLSSLNPGETIKISFNVQVDFTAATSSVFFNQVTGTGTIGTLALSDLSTSGVDADPDQDGDPGNNDEPTQFILSDGGDSLSIGLSLSVVDTTRIDDISYEITYMLLVGNLGSKNLDSIVLSNDLVNTFGNLSFEIFGQPTVNSSSMLNVNPDFDGTTDTNLLTSSFTNSLGVGVTDTLFYTVRLDHENNSGPFLNSVYGEGYSNGQVVSDSSNAGSEIIIHSNTPTIVEFAFNGLNSLVIPGGFSPNGDGVNDVFEIKFGDASPISEFQIYNRWGHVVYYQDPKFMEENKTILWDGKCNTSTITQADDLPDGVYYYVMQLENQKPKIGYIILNR